MRNFMRALAVALASAATAAAAQPAIPFDPQKLADDISDPKYQAGFPMEVGSATSNNYLLGVPLLHDDWSVDTLYLAGRVNVARIVYGDESGITRSVTALPGETIDVPGLPTPVTTYDFSGQGLNKPFAMSLLLGDGVMSTSRVLGQMPRLLNGGYQFPSGAQFSDPDYDPIGVATLDPQPWIDDPSGNALEPPLFYGFSYDVIQPAAIPGDFNTDGRVDITDFGLLKDHFGSGTTLAEGDANGDAKVDISDFGILKENFGKSGAAAVPEPATWLLSLFGLLAYALFRAGPAGPTAPGSRAPVAAAVVAARPGHRPEGTTC